MVPVARRVRILLTEGLLSSRARANVRRRLQLRTLLRVHPHTLASGLFALRGEEARAWVRTVGRKRRFWKGDSRRCCFLWTGQRLHWWDISHCWRRAYIQCTSRKTATTPFSRYGPQGQRLWITCGLFFVSAVLGVVVTGNDTETPRQDLHGVTNMIKKRNHNGSSISLAQKSVPTITAAGAARVIVIVLHDQRRRSLLACATSRPLQCSQNPVDLSMKRQQRSSGCIGLALPQLDLRAILLERKTLNNGATLANPRSQWTCLVLKHPIMDTIFG